VPNAQFTPHTAWDGLDYVVSWTDDRNPFPSSDARAVRISSAGVVLDPDGIALSAPQPATGHDLASNGNRRSLVAWTTSTGRGVVRALAANGTLGPTRALAPGVLASNPLLASNGTGFLAAFARTSAAGTRTDLIGTMVAPNGNPGPLFTIRRGIDGLENLTAAGDDYLAQFVEGGVRQTVTVSGNGRVSAPAPAPATLFSTLVSASSNRNSVLAWVTTTGEVQAQFFARGALRGPVLSIAASSDGFPPTIAFDGRRYWIVWAADRETELPLIRSLEVDGAVGATSQLVDQACEAPELASDGNQQMLLACFRFTGNFGFGPARITTRLVDTRDGAGGAAVASASAASTVMGAAVAE